MTYAATLTRVETYFDKTATRTWERLTSDAPVSRIRETVRKGRDTMRAQIISRLPADLRGARVLDAGCGTGQMTEALASHGASVVAIDISPALVEIARRRLPDGLAGRVTFIAGDMLSQDLGGYDYVVAMDSLLYYSTADVATALTRLGDRSRGPIVFTLAPRTRLLMAMWQFGRIFPRSNRAPSMVPQTAQRLAQELRDMHAPGKLRSLDRVTSGFYISQAMEYEPC